MERDHNESAAFMHRPWLLLGYVLLSGAAAAVVGALSGVLDRVADFEIAWRAADAWTFASVLSVVLLAAHPAWALATDLLQCSATLPNVARVRVVVHALAMKGGVAAGSMAAAALGSGMIRDAWATPTSLAPKLYLAVSSAAIGALLGFLLAAAEAFHALRGHGAHPRASTVPIAGNPAKAA